nr:hypothetical protein GCM10010200_061690 [Actinomadura rugatobispora]
MEGRPSTPPGAGRALPALAWGLATGPVTPVGAGPHSPGREGSAPLHPPTAITAPPITTAGAIEGPKTSHKPIGSLVVR